MESKTPKFDVLINEILKDLVPHTRECRWSGKHGNCEEKFEITKEDIEFIKVFQVPPPNFCPTCRRMRRFVHMGFAQLFKRPCNAPQHDESMISIYSPECPFPVYDYKFFISDEFDPFIFAHDFVDSDSPYNELLAMRKTFPMPSFLNRDPSCINSEYSNGGKNTKNCYYVSGCFDTENVWYTNLSKSSREVMDSRAVNSSEYVYSVLNSSFIYKSSYIYFSKDCTDSIFLFDCRNCTNCFGCVNLRNAKYCVWNKQLSKKDYEDFIISITPLSRDFIRKSEEQFWHLVKSLPLNASRNLGSVDVSGVHLRKVKNAYNSTDCNNSEHIRYVDSGLSHNDSMDVLFSGGKSHHLYSTTNIGAQSSNVKFSVSSKFCIDCEYVFNSKNLTSCFMCFGLQNKSYCILNKQYTPDEYFELVDKIKCKMLSNSEYGDGLGIEFSAQAYNFSLAGLYFSLSDAEVRNLGGYVASEPESNMGSTKVIRSDEVPQTIYEATNEVLSQAILCEVTGRPFRIVVTELEFYRRMGLPLPTVHPIVRMKRKYVFSPIGVMYKIDCAKCGMNFNSLFNPKDGYILYCEKCYQQEVY